MRRAFAIALLSGAAVVFAVRFEPPPSGLVEAEGEIVITTTTVPPTTTTLTPRTTTTTTTTLATNHELGEGTLVAESPLVRMNRGYVQVEITVIDGYLSQVEMIVVPSESRRAREISLDAHDILAVEAVETQSYRLHNVTGATETSKAWMYALKLAMIEVGMVIPSP
ncbi:MAG TPA: hypothetical protein VFY15_07100 [Acidimicrobiia bacterium]|nr:hypothetical protein [Acidimicrobiia bacterium]